MQITGVLGYRVLAGGVQPDPAKVEAIRSWSLPLGTRMEAQKFLGLAP